MTVEDIKGATVAQPAREFPFLLRVLWFFILGWELTGVWILVAWALNATIILLPVGLWMIDRVPQVLTLKARPGEGVMGVAAPRGMEVAWGRCHEGDAAPAYWPWIQMIRALLTQGDPCGGT